VVSGVWLIGLGLISGAAAGLLAGLIGIGGGIVVVPVVYYGLIVGGASGDQAAHVAVCTSLAAILPAAIVSSLGHWRAGNTDLAFLREWGPGIAAGVVLAQLAAPHLRGGLLTGLFGLFCLFAAVRFGLPSRFHPLLQQPPSGRLCHFAGAGIGLVSGLAGVGGGIMTNVVMTISGMSMHRSVGRAAAVGVVVSVPAVLIAILQTGAPRLGQLGDINLSMWACIAPAQAVTAWFGAQLTRRISAERLSQVFAIALFGTGVAMLHSSFNGL
jgi:uncharacterized membrane protein YfcA